METGLAPFFEKHVDHPEEDADARLAVTRQPARQLRHRGPLALDPLPDLVLLDVMLPRIDGFAVLKKVRADARLARVPVIVMSAFADRDQDVARTMQLGANDYIVKPLMEYHFLGRIKRLEDLRKE